MPRVVRAAITLRGCGSHLVTSGGNVSRMGAWGGGCVRPHHHKRVIGCSVYNSERVRYRWL